MLVPSTTSSYAWTGRSSLRSSSRGPRTSATSAGTRAAVESPREPHATRLKGEVCDAHLMPDADVDALAKEVVDWYVEWNPIFATYIGIHGHDHLMPKGTADAELEERARIVEYLRRVEAIDRKGLPPGKRVDWGVMRNAFRLWIFGSEELALWHPMPHRAQTRGDALSPPFVRASYLPRSKDRVGIGGAKFRKLVRLRELGLPVDEIYAVGKKYLRESKKALVQVAAAIRPGASVEEAKEIVKSDHPARFEEALAYTAKAMADAKAFIRQHDLATIPANEELTVIETPAYLRHVIPFAAYNSPARFESHKQGFYMVTPVEDKPEMLREHSD